MGDVTELLTEAAKGNRQAQDKLYQLTEPEMRKLALHWIRRKSAKERVRTTELINRAFVKLMRIDADRWQHRGLFYKFASQNILGVLIDLLPRYNLRLMSAVENVSGLPRKGENLVIVAAVDRALHFRIFDAHGQMVVDTDEPRLIGQARQVEDLRKQLEGMWPPHELTRSEKSRVISTVKSIVGHALRPHESRPPGGAPAQPGGVTLHTLLTLQEALKDLEKALSVDHRAVVELRFLAECTLDEVAECLSIKRDKAFRMSNVALAYLRNKLSSSFSNFGDSSNHASGD
jgi:DNA-directed RNA polymerase specialized sigma24 family protein